MLGSYIMVTSEFTGHHPKHFKLSKLGCTNSWVRFGFGALRCVDFDIISVILSHYKVSYAIR